MHFMKMRTLTAAVLSRLSPLVPGSATAQVVRCPRSISGRGVAGGRKLPPPVHLLDEDLEEKFVKASWTFYALFKCDTCSRSVTCDAAFLLSCLPNLLDNGVRH